MTDDARYWFRAKRYGYGWGIPVTWQGWAVLGAYLVVILAPLALGGAAGATGSLVALVIATPLLVWVGYRKGEPPAWRWGRDQPRPRPRSSPPVRSDSPLTAGWRPTATTETHPQRNGVDVSGGLA